MSIKTRLIPIILFSEYRAVKTIEFKNPRHIGSPVANVKLYSRQKVDELIFIDINAYKENNGPKFELIGDVIEESFMPLTIGGGIRNIEDISKLLQLGADKVSINTNAILNPNFIREAAYTFGSQCIVVSVDAKRVTKNQYEICIEGGRTRTDKSPLAFCMEAEQKGAGEILLNSIDNDGKMSGYDIELIKMIADNLSIPVIAAGGAGTLQHFVDVINQGHASAAAASSIFHYTQENPMSARAYMKACGLDVRN